MSAVTCRDVDEKLIGASQIPAPVVVGEEGDAAGDRPVHFRGGGLRVVRENMKQLETAHVRTHERPSRALRQELAEAGPERGARRDDLLLRREHGIRRRVRFRAACVERGGPRLAIQGVIGLVRHFWHKVGEAGLGPEPRALWGEGGAG